MNVSMSTGSSAASALQALASASRTRASQSGDFSASSAAARPEGPPPAPPPGPPPSQDLGGAMSTAQFAQSTQGRDDPLMALDSDGDGAVSSSEFGIGDGTDSQVQALFKAIDGNGDGSLSASETDAFRQQMMQALDSQQGPLGPPPQGGGSAQDFVKQLAQMYAGLSSQADSNSAGAGVSVLA